MASAEEKWRIGEGGFFEGGFFQPPPHLHIFGAGRVGSWPILVNLRAFENNQGWEVKREGKETQMNLLAVKPVIEAYGIYLPPVWSLYLPAFFLREENER